MPPQLVAGIVHIEVGGDPLINDDVGYTLRSGALKEDRDRTSFYNVSIQVRRAIQSLDYDISNDVSDTQRRYIINSLKQPQTNIFIAAKHISDLRDIYFKGVPAKRLSREQIKIIATRYNRGPDISFNELIKDMSNGATVLKRWNRMSILLR